VQYRHVGAEAFAKRPASFGTSPAMVQATPTTFRQWCEQVLKPAVAG
jgi:hypothetical protein